MKLSFNAMTNMDIITHHFQKDQKQKFSDEQAIEVSLELMVMVLNNKQNKTLDTRSSINI